MHRENKRSLVRCYASSISPQDFAVPRHTMRPFRQDVVLRLPRRLGFAHEPLHLPSFDPAGCSPDALRRFQHPDEYPCFNRDGVYKPVSGCRERCCMLPPGTPEGEDTPKWKETLAARQQGASPMARKQGASPMAQPIFDDEEPQVVTPFKDHVAPSSGSTPLGESSFNHRIHLRMSGGPDLNTQPGIKGWREESPVK